MTASRDITPFRLHPLRIPSGWEVRGNVVGELEPTECPAEAFAFHFVKDMLRMVRADEQVLVDLGWFGSKEDGTFFLCAVQYPFEHKQWDYPLRELTTRSLKEVVGTLEAWLTNDLKPA